MSQWSFPCEISYLRSLVAVKLVNQFSEIGRYPLSYKLRLVDQLFFVPKSQQKGIKLPMYNKIHLLPTGLEIRISSMSETHLHTTAKARQDDYNAFHRAECLIQLFDYVEEIEWREDNNRQQYNWHGISTIQIKEEARKKNIKLNIQNDTTSTKQIRRLSKEEEEKLWQETEQRILPEGDKDKIELLKFYCQVDKITRRIDLPFGQDTLPMIFDNNNSINNNLIKKKVKITIEVLED